MMGTPSNRLLREYVARGSEPAFRDLVELHVDLVYSTALRRVGGNAHLAADVTQTTFTDLARKAAKLDPDIVLAGWLYRNTCFRAATAVRGEIRRRLREQKAAEMNVADESVQDTWSRFGPLLDDALRRLSDRDRDAVILRYFENKTLAETAHAIGLSEGAAQKRVSRALDKLRNYFGRHGVQVAAGTMAAAMTSNAVRSAPAGLAAETARMAHAAGFAASSTSSVWLAGILTVGSAAAIALLVMSRPSHAVGAALPQVRTRAPAAVVASAAPIQSPDSATPPTQPAPGTNADSSVSSPTPAAPPMSGAELLSRMAKTYATCRSYFDRGLVSTLYIESNGRRRIQERPFTTAFVRNDRFRFEYWTEGDQPKTRYIIWSDGATTQTWWNLHHPELQTDRPLASAVAGAAGVSGASSATVPNLLLPDQLRGMKLSSMAFSECGPTETIDGVPCVSIKGQVGFTSQIMTIWVEQDTGLLRKIYATHDFGTFRTETTTTYSPVINQPIPNEVLQFDAPKGP